ncbi:MAG: hypothetical protein MUD16_09625 [Desulfobacterales bacterium]|nr:hypothetical protein [Desulfobacterales bacterium]
MRFRGVGKNAGGVEFRQQFNVTVVGIRRGQERIVSPGAHERLMAEDRLVVLGEREAVDRMQQACPL